VKYNRIYAILLWLTLSFLVLTGCGAQPAAPGADQVDAFIYGRDTSGEIIRGYAAREDRWYLFVPSAMDIPALTLICAEPVTELSAGTPDAEATRITGAFRSSGDQVTVTTASGSYTVTVMQSQLPSVCLWLDGGTLETVHDNKDTRVRISRFSLTEPGGIRDLTVGNGAEIKGRGNSSWELYEKKGYQIRFDEKISLLGMERAKKWVLLANAGDDSMIRAKLVHDLARGMDMGYTPELEHVDLWVDGEYLGTYLLGEKAEIATGRLNLHSNIGALFEHDENYFAEEDYWFVNNSLRRHFVVKEITVEEDAAVAAAQEAFNDRLDSLMHYLYTTLPRDVTLERLGRYIDVDSFAKYYLINEYVLNCESFATSFYWYQDGASDVLHMGPVWDFDTCMGNDSRLPSDSYGQQHLLFTYLLASPAFRQRTEEIYRQYKADFAALAEGATLLENRIGSSARMNYLRWEALGQPNVKPHSTAFSATYSEAVESVCDWLRKRQELFTIPECRVVNSVVSDDCRTMDLFFEDDRPHEALVFAAWPLHSDGENKTWVEAQEKDGVWHARVDMTRVNESGMFRLDVLELGKNESLATGRNVVETAVPRDYAVEAYLTDNGNTLTIAMQDHTGSCRSVAFALWGEENDQDDLIWLEAEQNADGLWAVTMDAAALKEEGTYFVHVWGSKEHSESEFLEGIAFRRSYPAEAFVSEDGNALHLVLNDFHGARAVSFAVWGLLDNQEDIVWADARRNADGLWECAVDLDHFSDDAMLAVHAYGNITGEAYRFFSELILEIP